MSTFYRRHRWILKLASMVYFTPCSYNEKTGVFEETRWNRAVFGLSFSLAIPFWFANIHLMTTRYLRTYSSVLAAVGGIELVIYVSVLTCAMLNVFVHRKRITMLMNVLFRTDWLLDSFGGSAFDDRHYDDNRVFLAITAFMAFGFCCKFRNHKDIASKILSVLIGLRFYAVFLVAFVHRICVNAIKLRMEQLRILYCSDLFEHNVHFFVERFGRYHRQIVEETALCTRHFDDYRLQNTRAAKQIQKFLLKNLHQKKKFSACGFFDIDNTVIYMVFSSIVTYLVILIQFKQLETDLTNSLGASLNGTNNASVGAS
uniref:Gustatory receptor n=1 Tax=Anopheles atroparvus TaxID=41427 RepID=A0AAG5DDJ0_ANOAO